MGRGWGKGASAGTGREINSSFTATIIFGILAEQRTGRNNHHRMGCSLFIADVQKEREKKTLLKRMVFIHSKLSVLDIWGFLILNQFRRGSLCHLGDSSMDVKSVV